LKIRCLDLKKFHKPNVTNEKFRFGKLDEKRIKKILVQEHDFSEERVEKQLERLRQIREEMKQKGLEKWF